MNKERSNISKTQLINNKYDKYGNPIGLVLDDIQKGDRVMYIDSKPGYDGKGWITVKVELFGIWDGEKVQFDDKDHTLVRTKHWLKLVK